jgi:hypothetical protein
MIFSKKSEIDLFKKHQAELIREEKRLMKELQEQEHLSKQKSRDLHTQKIKDLEDRLFEELSSRASRKSRHSSLDIPPSINTSFRSNLSQNDHLDKLKELQEKAKNLLNPQTVLEKIPERPVQQSPSVSPLKIPVMIPQSMMRKAQHLPPPTVQRVMKNGDVVTVHLLSDKSRINDPLVKAEAQIDGDDINAMTKQMKGKNMNQIISEIQNQFVDKNPKKVRAESMPLKRKYKISSIQLPDAEIPEDRLADTPKGKPEYYNFRDLALDMVSQQTARSWVVQRMKQYSDKVKKQFIPKTSEKKELELALMMEKMKKGGMQNASRVKLLE